MTANENARRQPGVDTSNQNNHNRNSPPIKPALQLVGGGLFAIRNRMRVTALRRKGARS